MLLALELYQLSFGVKIEPKQSFVPAPFEGFLFFGF
jgi:hypothetical protein